MEEEDAIMLDTLAEMAYDTLYKGLNNKLEYFEREEIKPFSSIPDSIKEIWREVVRCIINSYPTMEEFDKP